MTSDNLLWDPYVLIRDHEIKEFWTDVLSKNEKTLFILARGFDPRMNTFTNAIYESLNENVEFAILNIEGENGPHTGLSKKNWEELKVKLSKKGIEFRDHELEMWKVKKYTKSRVGPNNAVELINNGLIEGFKHVILDISSIPRAIYFSLLTAILNHSRKRNENGEEVNVYVNLVENPIVDKSITSDGIDDKAEFIPGLGGDFLIEHDLVDLEGAEKPKIWIPVLGERQEFKLKKIEELVEPKIICPVLPFPSSKPRRPDDMLLEYRELLFDSWLVEHENIIYASENNPFELYRQLIKTISRYTEALQPIGGCKIALSTLSSKLISIGAFLSSYELYRVREESVGLVHVGGSAYNYNSSAIETESAENEYLITLWLDGSPYN